MKNNNLFRSLLILGSLLFGTLTFTSCDDAPDAPKGAYSENGVFIINEGNFGTPNGSVTYYNKNTKDLTQELFKKENQNRPLGDVVQSMSIHDDRAFIVVNNSNKIEIVNPHTFESKGVVEGLNAPRYFTTLNSAKGYVTEWLAPNPDYSYNKGRVSVINLKTMAITKQIEVSVQPEQLLISGGKLYVTNSGGNTVTVINTATDAVEKNIELTFGPNSLALDKANNLWVLSSGNKDWKLPVSSHTAGALTKINTTTNTVTSTFTFDKASAMADKLVIDRGRDAFFYNYDGKVYKLSTTATALNHTPVIDKSFYGLGIDPATGNIYGGDAGNFTSDGTVFIYQPNGTQVYSFKAGIAPNGFVFN